MPIIGYIHRSHDGSIVVSTEENHAGNDMAIQLFSPESPNVPEPGDGGGLSPLPTPSPTPTPGTLSLVVRPVVIDERSATTSLLDPDFMAQIREARLKASHVELLLPQSFPTLEIDLTPLTPEQGSYCPLTIRADISPGTAPEISSVISQNAAHRSIDDINLIGLKINRKRPGSVVSVAGSRWCIYGCEITQQFPNHNPGLYIVPTAAAPEGSNSYSAPGKGFWFENNYVHDIGGEACYMGGAATREGREIGQRHQFLWFRNNVVRRAGLHLPAQPDLLDIKLIDYVEIEGNIFADLEGRGQNSRPLVTQGVRNLIVHKNFFENIKDPSDACVAVNDTWGIPLNVKITDNKFKRIQGNRHRGEIIVYRVTGFSCMTGNLILSENNQRPATVIMPRIAEEYTVSSRDNPVWEWAPNLVENDLDKFITRVDNMMFLEGVENITDFRDKYEAGTLDPDEPESPQPDPDLPEVPDVEPNPDPGTPPSDIEVGDTTMQITTPGLLREFAINPTGRLGVVMNDMALAKPVIFESGSNFTLKGDPDAVIAPKIMLDMDIYKIDPSYPQDKELPPVVWLKTPVHSAAIERLHIKSNAGTELRYHPQDLGYTLPVAAVVLNGENCRVSWCQLSGCLNGIGSFGQSVSGSKITHNIIHNYGGYSGRMRFTGHGIYAQNRGPFCLISNNLIGVGAGFCLHVYGSEASSLDNFVVTNNLFFGGQVLFGGRYTPANNVVFKHNLCLEGGAILGYWYGSDNQERRNSKLACDNNHFYNHHRPTSIQLQMRWADEDSSIRNNWFWSGKGSRQVAYIVRNKTAIGLPAVIDNVGNGIDRRHLDSGYADTPLNSGDPNALVLWENEISSMRPSAPGKDFFQHVPQMRFPGQVTDLHVNDYRFIQEIAQYPTLTIKHELFNLQ